MDPMDTSDKHADPRGGEDFSRPKDRKRARVSVTLGLKPGHRFDYKDISVLKHFIGPQGKIIPRRVSGLSALEQRSLVTAVKRARQIALLPYTSADR